MATPRAADKWHLHMLAISAVHGLLTAVASGHLPLYSFQGRLWLPHSPAIAACTSSLRQWRSSMALTFWRTTTATSRTSLSCRGIPACVASSFIYPLSITKLRLSFLSSSTRHSPISPSPLSPASAMPVSSLHASLAQSSCSSSTIRPPSSFTLSIPSPSTFSSLSQLLQPSSTPTVPPNTLCYWPLLGWFEARPYSCYPLSESLSSPSHYKTL